jgi:hypothetical protein
MTESIPIPVIHRTSVNGIATMRDRCLEFINNDDIKKYVRETFKPIINIIYNEIYLYIWFISLYNVFLLFITLANLFILQKILKKMNASSYL